MLEKFKVKLSDTVNEALFMCTAVLAAMKAFDWLRPRESACSRRFIEAFLHAVSLEIEIQLVKSVGELGIFPLICARSDPF